MLAQAQQLGLVTEQQSWILTDLDSHTLDLNPYKYDNTNFTLFRNLDFSRPFVRHSLHNIVREELLQGRSLDFTALSGGLDSQSALIYDAVHLLAVALGHLQDIQQIRPASIQCSRQGSTWQHGSSILNFMRLSHIPGLTRDVTFDTLGRRSHFQLDLLNLFETEGLAKVGGWDPQRGLELPGLARDEPPASVSLANRTLVVTTILNDPYMMMRESAAVLAGNQQYEGFVPDMVEALSRILGFNVTLRVVEDGNYGGWNGVKWNGMIQEVLTGMADMAVADLSITTGRLEAVEFSMPWMNLGISIIYQKPRKAPPGLLSFMEPFSDGVWLCTVGAILLTAFLTFLIGRFSPHEWFNPNFCILRPVELETQWNVSNSVWHTIGALMQQANTHLLTQPF